MTEIILHVSGMTCNHCVNAVEKALTQLPGIERALVDLDQGQVHIQYEENQIEPQQMEQAIEEAGYEVDKAKSR